MPAAKRKSPGDEFYEKNDLEENGPEKNRHGGSNKFLKDKMKISLDIWIEGFIKELKAPPKHILFAYIDYLCFEHGKQPPGRAVLSTIWNELKQRLESKCCKDMRTFWKNPRVQDGQKLGALRQKLAMAWETNKRDLLKIWPDETQQYNDPSTKRQNKGRCNETTVAIPEQSLLYRLVLTIGWPIVNRGRAATIMNLTGGIAIEYAGVTRYKQLLMSEPEHGLVVLRDDKEFSSKKRPTLNSELQKLFENTTRDFTVEVNDLGLKHTVLTTHLSMGELERRWDMPVGQENAPINLLNLTCNSKNLIPGFIAEKYDFLERVITDIEKSKEPNAGKGAPAPAGPLRACQKFSICGKEGAISGWHLDLLAPYTLVTLEKSGKNIPSRKLWPIVRLDLVPTKLRKQLLAEFAAAGPTWTPPAYLIEIISLEEGDTLIMPPFTIHAPITVTDCFFSGAMLWCQETFVQNILPALWFGIKHYETVTNEIPSIQIAEVLRFCIGLIRKEPEAFRLSSEEEIDGAVLLCKDIIDLVDDLGFS